MQGSGCLSMESKSNRQNVSSEGTTGCPFKVLSGLQCPAIGSPSDVVGHVKRHHVVDTQEKPGPFAVKLQKFSQSINFHKAIIISSKLCYLLWVIKKDTVHFLVYITPKDECEKYTYDFKIQKGKEEISITDAICSSSLQRQSKVMPNGDIIRLHRPTVQNYLDENGDLSCVIDIRRKRETASLGAASDTRDTIESHAGKRKLEELRTENRKHETLSRRSSKRTRRANFFRYVRCQTQWATPRYQDVRTRTQRPFKRHFSDWYWQQKTRGLNRCSARGVLNDYSIQMSYCNFKPHDVTGQRNYQPAYPWAARYDVQPKRWQPRWEPSRQPSVLPVY